MPKYLAEGSYAPEGVHGLLKQGGSQRRKNLEDTLQKLGGKVEAFYYAFGDSDVYAIIDLPDDATAMALSMTVNASGAVMLKTTRLLDPEQIDEACKKSIDYRPPID